MKNKDSNTIIRETAEKLVGCVESTIKNRVGAEISYKNSEAGDVVFTNSPLSVLGKIRASEELITNIESCAAGLREEYPGLEVTFHPGRPSISIENKFT